MRILLATSELYPYSKTGGLADMVAALGKTLARQGHKVGVVTPLYGPILQKAGELGLERMDWNLTLMLDWRTVQGSVWYLNKDGQDIYFIGQQELFNRSGIYQENGHDYFDNPERFIFFSKAVENLAMYLPWQPDMVHVHDWQTSLVPLLLTHSMESGKLKRAVGTCLTIHNLAYQGVYASSVFAMANLPWGYFGPSGSEFYGNFNFLKTGIVFSDKLTTVSPQYAKEIQGQEYGANLNGVLNQRQNDLVGILNGADYDVWNTEKNPALKYSYSLKNMSGKAKNKQALQEKLGLPQNPQIPLFGNIGRMAEQKGIDILIPALEDMLAGEIHRMSRRSGSSMVCVDVGSLPESLFESELFGHVKGAFTDARADRAGKFEVASGGTLFLDEIGNLPLHLQMKLLTAIQTKSVTRVGSNTPIPVDIRLICATNRDLAKMVASGAFREDLYFRINTIHLTLPPLRERPGDIVPLAQMFMRRYAVKYGKDVIDITEEALKALEACVWKGNIRELQHVVEKAVILADGDVLDVHDFFPDDNARAFSSAPSPAASPGRVMTLDEMEKEMIREALRRNDGNMSAVALQLGITRQTLYNKLRKYGL